MIDWTLCLAVALITTALAASSAAAQPPPRKLAHDPFERRVAQQLVRQAGLRPAVATPSTDGAPASSPAALQAPVLAAELRAVMIGGMRPLVNLGGKILGIGDSVEGFRLVEVLERGAVFTRDGIRVELALGRNREP